MPSVRSLRVGAALSQTGIYALQGRQAGQALRLWVEDVNARGGLHVAERGGALALDLILYDDGSRRADVGLLIERLIVHDGVDFLIGPYSSGLTHAAAAVAEAHAKLMWNHGGSSDAIMRQGFRWLVNIPTPASRYFAGLFACLAGYVSDGARLAIVQRQGSAFAAEVAAGVRQQAEQAGLSPLPPRFYPQSPAEMPAWVRQLAAAQPAIIVGVGRYADDVALVRGLAEHHVDVEALAVVATPMQAFRDDLRHLAEGCLGPSQWEPEDAVLPDVGPTSAAFGARYRRRFGEAPDYPAAQAFAAGVLLERCVTLAGTCRDNEVRRVAWELVCRTFYGRFQLDPSSGVQVGHDTVLVQWQTGVKRIVWPPEVAQAPPLYPKPVAGG
jgi:branched-chain amino acid transport system substrate-binding protein